MCRKLATEFFRGCGYIFSAFYKLPLVRSLKLTAMASRHSRQFKGIIPPSQEESHVFLMFGVGIDERAELSLSPTLK